jgi:hypothetical protein
MQFSAKLFQVADDRPFEQYPVCGLMVKSLPSGTLPSCNTPPTASTLSFA